MAAALFLAARAATAQDLGHGLLGDDDPNDAGGPIHIRTSVTLNFRPESYALWYPRDFLAGYVIDP